MADDTNSFELPQLYSRRQRNLKPSDDVFRYEGASERLRIQIGQILKDAIGTYFTARGNHAPARAIYDSLVKLMRRELGVHALTPYADTAQHEFFGWLEKADFPDWLDGVEVAMRMIDGYVRKNPDAFRTETKASPDDAISEINARMREDKLGYAFNSGTIIRIDSQLLHSEVVLPALSLLRDARFETPNREFREAHAAFRMGNNKDCIVGCGRAFESVLKIIGAARNWPISETDTASKLIAAAASQGFLPSFSQTSLNHLKGLLESSVPTIRNKNGGHGAGVAPLEVSEELAAFQLHQTAAVLVFLIEHDQRMGAAPLPA